MSISKTAGNRFDRAARAGAIDQMDRDVSYVAQVNDDVGKKRLSQRRSGRPTSFGSSFGPMPTRIPATGGIEHIGNAVLNVARRVASQARDRGVAPCR
jgi:hypothetical protein